MPLSEDEERILSEIEQQFYEDDPEFARGVGQSTLYRYTPPADEVVRPRLRRRRACSWCASLSTSFLLAFGGFLLMLGCALYFERNLRKLGKAGLEHVTRSMKADHLRDALGGARGRLRDRFRRGDE